MSAFYNEFEPFAAAWLRELIKAGVIEDGEVCEKDMWDVVPSELAGFERVHFCAGIGGWAEALRLSGWPDDQQVWTVSLPCQPFSTAGKGSGLADARGQLAEAFFWLAGVCRPGIIFGEQVEAAIRHDWLDVVASSLESIGYTVGAVAFPAASVGAFHIRQRLYWVAYAERYRQNRKRVSNFKREKILEFAGSSYKKPWVACPMPRNAKDYRNFLLLADGIQVDLDSIGSFGNAIVPQAAAAFITAAMEIMDE